MNQLPDPRHDPRSVDELFCAALTEQPDDEDDAYWDAISALNFRGTREVFERGAALCRSHCAIERRIGADVLAQLGVPERTLPAECIALLLSMLRADEEPALLHSVLIALSHHEAPQSIHPAVRFLRHADEDVRYAVVAALTGYDHPLAVESLIELSTDKADQVRDWATFALAQQLDSDTPEIRAGLAARLDDPYEDCCGEAMIGLARRRDPRAPAAVERELRLNPHSDFAAEAAELIAGTAAASLYCPPASSNPG
ncbi:MAG: HEAT repeat domain-containing protein [Pirellulales bacterium]|nr:HEAT repeat domain-containing protein [Pirellulales bacterium]